MLVNCNWLAFGDITESMMDLLAMSGAMIIDIRLAQPHDIVASSHPHSSWTTAFRRPWCFVVFCRGGGGGGLGGGVGHVYINVHMQLHAK